MKRRFCFREAEKIAIPDGEACQLPEEENLLLQQEEGRFRLQGLEVGGLDEALQMMQTIPSERLIIN